MINQQLVDYVKQQLKAGVSLENITSVLQSQGWQDPDIVEALNSARSIIGPLQSQTTQPPLVVPESVLTKDPRASKKKIVITAGVLILLLTILITVHAYYRFVVSNKSSTGTTQAISQNESTNSNPLPYRNSLRHSIFLESLGVKSSTEGNGADDYMKFIGTEGKHGYWWSHYGGKNELDIKEDNIQIDSQDKKFLYAIADKKTFSLFPEHFYVPNSVIDNNGSNSSNLDPATLGIMARRFVAEAKRLEAAGNNTEAEKLLLALLTFGRKIEDQKYAPQIWLLSGITLEKNAAAELKTIYSNGASPKLMALQKYNDETLRIELETRDWFSKSFGISTYSSMLYKGSKDNRSVDSVYEELGGGTLSLSRQQFQALLTSLKDANEEIIQTAILGSMVFLSHATNMEPERSMAQAVLDNYSQSLNAYVKNLALSAIKTTPDELIKFIKSQPF
ncbi:hypothetical protein HYV91_02110 [Candidatus Wolfebacteria bacterium]|nr:hypothetical protein [Candidatus Wolfebacteria bacterium]